MRIYDFTHLNLVQQKIFDEFLFKLCSKSSPLSYKNNEEDFRICFENELNELLRELGFIKKGYEVFLHENKRSRGRTDFQYGNTIIEYKKYGTLDNKKLFNSQNQLQNYLLDKDFKGFVMFGFLFDGVSLYAYKKDENDKIIFDEKHSGLLNPLNLSFFISTIFQSGVRSLSPLNLKNDFGIIDKNNSLLDNDEVRLLAQILFEKLKNTKLARTKLLFNEWEKLFRLAENDNGKHQDIKERREVFAKIFSLEITKESEYQAFFALHTTLSIIIKLLLVRIIDDKINIDDFYKSQSLSELKDFFIHLENGKHFARLGISNLTDNDFFSWYAKEEFNDSFKESVQKIIFKICAYENIHIVRNTAMLDIFKELYQNFIPKCVRHSFGEYYTPYYLAEKTFLCAIKDDENAHLKSYIDPNCGSGTFLSVFFNHKHHKLKDKIDFSHFVKDIVGIDINPLAILMARANILIQGLQKCTFDPLKKYEIPVYLADSLYVPELIKIDNIPCFSYSLYTSSLQKAFKLEAIKITLPKSLVENENFLQIIAEVERHIINLDAKKARQSFLKYSNIKSKAIENLIEKCVLELIAFEKKNLNSIWLKIFSNYFRVATFKGFDYIIGNPAWVQWSVLPEAYRENTKKNMRMDGLFSSDKNVGGNNLNICALIANKCCERWLKKEGKFCFLMPKSILFNKSFEGFRRLIINNNEKMYFNEVLDFSKGGEIFEGVGLDFCAFKISKTPNSNEDIVPFIEYSKNNKVKLNHNDTWQEASKGFKASALFAIKLNSELNNNFLITQNIERAKYLKSLIGKCEYQFRKGVNVPYAMRLVFVDFAKDKKRGIFYPYAKIGRRLKLDTSKKIELEFDFIKPFVSAPMLSDDKTKQWSNDYCICAYERGAKKPLSEERLQILAPYTYKYLKDIEDSINKGSQFNKRVQNFDEFYGILRMGIYVYSDTFVCIRDNTRLAPTLFTKLKTHWKKLESPLFDNHISFISEVLVNKKHERFIDLAEAKYILEKLNDKDIQEIILNSQDNRSISSRLPVSIKFYK